MTELTDQFRLDVPADEAFWVCREAVMYLDWPLLESIEPHRVVLKRGLRFGTGSLSRIEVLLSQAGPDATSVRLHAKYPGGIGRADERTLRSMMKTVQNAMEVVARRSARQRQGLSDASVAAR